MAALPEDGFRNDYNHSWFPVASSDLELTCFSYPASDEHHDMFCHISKSSLKCVEADDQTIKPDHNDLDRTNHPDVQQVKPTVSPSLAAVEIDDIVSIPAYDEQFSTILDARRYLADEETRMLQLDRMDDVSDVRASLHMHCARLFAALTANPVQAPARFTPFQILYYDKNQATTLTDVKSSVVDNNAHAEARVMVVIDEVMQLHSLGVPLSSTSYTKSGSKNGYRLDESLICSERVERVIEAAQKNKCVAHDILNDRGVKNLVLNPKEYLKRKQENARVNAKKSYDKSQAGKHNSSFANRSTELASNRRYGAKGQIYVKSNMNPPRGQSARRSTGREIEHALNVQVHARADDQMHQQEVEDAQRAFAYHHVRSAQSFQQDEMGASTIQDGSRKRIKRG
jgi:hypothetical protein